jgi:oxaloacetate decarboxylase alpha subunit
MNIKEIKEMINLMNDNSLAELEVEKDGMRIRLKKTSGQMEGMSAPIMIEKEKIADAARQTEMAAEPTRKQQPSNVVEIKAPMVGTFYRAPSPEAPPYVEVGQVIEPGQVICIIEAMKLMNEIKSEIKGKVAEVLVENTEPVEYGQPMFIIEPV